MPSGVFFSVDGIDGAGKSTQMAKFHEWLSGFGREVVVCRDPGSTSLGESVRTILLDRHDLAIHRRSEMLLYMAARAQLVEEVIRPSLARGAIVLSDRFLLANVVYQAHAGGLPIDSTWEVGKVATDGLDPDLTLVLDLDAELAWQRLRSERTHQDRMESQGMEFLQRVRAGFIAETAAPRSPTVLIDADRPREVIQEEMRAAARPYLDRLRHPSS